jgi:hypothetical protein
MIVEPKSWRRGGIDGGTSKFKNQKSSIKNQPFWIPTGLDVIPLDPPGPCVRKNPKKFQIRITKFRSAPLRLCARNEFKVRFFGPVRFLVHFTTDLNSYLPELTLNRVPPIFSCLCLGLAVLRYNGSSMTQVSHLPGSTNSPLSFLTVLMDTP